MKKIIIVLVLFSSFLSFAQSYQSHEVRLNAYSVIVFKWLDVSYEHVFNEESSVGISLVTDLDKNNRNGYFGGNQKYAITPYYRYLVPKHLMNGIFFEAFLSANGGENRIKSGDMEELEGLIPDEDDYVYPEYCDFAFGFGIGYKYVSDSGFVGELYGGAGRNLTDENAPEIVPRVGVSFGFRF